MQHQYQAIAMQDCEVIIPHPSEGSDPVVMPVGEQDTRIGCKVCNMCLDEALTLPCPGRPVERMLEGTAEDGS